MNFELELIFFEVFGVAVKSLFRTSILTELRSKNFVESDSMGDVKNLSFSC